MRISDWSSDVCSSDLKTAWTPFMISCRSKASGSIPAQRPRIRSQCADASVAAQCPCEKTRPSRRRLGRGDAEPPSAWRLGAVCLSARFISEYDGIAQARPRRQLIEPFVDLRSEEHTSELQSQ